MYGDSDSDDESPAMIFSRSVKPASRHMVRVLQEEDSPVAGRQVFHMLEQNQSPQEVQKQRNRVEHCAGGLVLPQSAAAASSQALALTKAVAVSTPAACGASCAPGTSPLAWIGSPSSPPEQQQQRQQPTASPVIGAGGNAPHTVDDAATGMGDAAAPVIEQQGQNQQQQQQPVDIESPVSVDLGLPAGTMHSRRPAGSNSSGLRSTPAGSGSSSQDASSNRGTTDLFVGQSAAAAADDQTPATPQLLQAHLDIGDAFTPWLCTSMKRPAESASLPGSALSLSSSDSGSRAGASSSSSSSSLMKCWTGGLQLRRQQHTAAGSAKDSAFSELVTPTNMHSAGAVNMQLQFTPVETPVETDNNTSNCSDDARCSSRKASSEAFTLATPAAAATDRTEPEEAYHSACSRGNNSSSSSDEYDDCPLTFTRTKQRQPAAPRTVAGSVQRGIRWDSDSNSSSSSDGGSSSSSDGGGSSSRNGSDSDSSWSEADSEDDEAGSSSSGCTPQPHHTVPSRDRGVPMGSNHGCNSSGCMHTHRANGPGSCSRVTPGSSGSLVARRRGRLQSPLSNQQQQSGLASRAAADPYDFDAHVSDLLGRHTGVKQQQQQWEPDGGWSPSPRTALPLTSAAAGGRRSHLQAAAAGVRHVPFASPFNPPPLKPHMLLASPAAAAAAAAAGRRLSIAPSADAVTPSAGAAAGAATGRGAGGKAGGAAGAGARQPMVCMTAPAKAPSSRTFARQRQQLSQQLYNQWNAQVFDGGLPAVLLVWNPRLTSTAGQVVDDGSQNRLKENREERVPVRLELSTKVLDCEARLRTTLAHEMCHVAAWAVSREFKQHHGPAFWAWARRFEARVPGIKVSTCHNYEVHAPFRWQCGNNSCGKQYHRHKRSIDPAKHVCSRCSGRLMYLGKFSRDGKLVATAAAAAGTPGATPGGNAFSQFVKSHFAQTKRELPAGTPHKELMSRLAADYKLHKASAQQQQQQPPASQQPADLQPVWQQQQQLGEVLVEDTRVEVVELSDSEDEAGGSDSQPLPQQQQQATWDERDDQEDVGGLLSFLQRLDLAGAD